jgi:hypothetical protein
MMTHIGMVRQIHGETDKWGERDIWNRETDRWTDRELKKRKDSFVFTFLKSKLLNAFRKKTILNGALTIFVEK